MSEDFDISQEETGFRFAKVRKLCFLCSCKKLTRLAYLRGAYVLHHPPARLARKTVSWSEKKVITFEIWIFLLRKRMDSLQEAFIHPPEPCEARFIMDARTLFHVFWTVENKHSLTPIERLGGARTIFYITPTGFVWKKKVIYTYDALRVSKTG